MFVNDGSKDKTWEIINRLSKENIHFTGISQSRNRGHQNAVLAGLMEAREKCDITISIDCDGQDDITASEDMVKEYLSGSEVVYGVRESRYPLGKMLGLALDGITSLSVKPLRMISALGVVISIISFIAVIWAVVSALIGNTVSGWASMMSVVCFVGGIQLVCLGVIGEYIGKIYTEAKARPRYIISDRTDGGSVRIKSNIIALRGNI